ncbi:hypothetical protein [Halorientalis pallida]|uniref:Uncharacterized protein n=1 Tax=Halorientalis pallida TaxID=2479928 RepID=A0A498KU65_9EURY|nr:hypothetical protein [Halorientalis pallida]RXK46904.1 hypothetical protein EAF64_17305 [Halorientalis pallida]
MDRRSVLRSLTVAGLGGLAGCFGLGGDGDEPIGRRVQNRKAAEPRGYRVDFHDQADTLGQVARSGTTGRSFDTVTNSRSETEWDRMKRNDMEYTRQLMDENRTSVTKLRPYVERTLASDDPKTEPWPHAIAWGIGNGLNDHSGVASSYDAALITVPLVDHFADLLFDRRDRIETWTVAAAEPPTLGEFRHLAAAMAYETDDGSWTVRYLEPTLGCLGDVCSTPDFFESSLRPPDESLYARRGATDFVTGPEFRKAQRLADRRYIQEDDEASRGDWNQKAISGAVCSSMTNLVDTAGNDMDMGEAPPAGIETVTSRSFGRSLEDDFDSFDYDTMRRMEFVGRAITLTFEQRRWYQPLGLDGTLDDPELYVLNEDEVRYAWNNYDQWDHVPEVVEAASEAA